MLCTIRKRAKEDDRKSCQITLEDLKRIWDEQGGICPYTGWKMLLPPNASKGTAHVPEKASVDRIDSSLPYMPDNIQFVSLIAQYAKNQWQGAEIIRFCEAVVSYQFHANTA